MKTFCDVIFMAYLGNIIYWYSWRYSKNNWYSWHFDYVIINL